ncbi:hypothetical protein DYB25_002149 [Aphanomyces astaci]|uniref:Bacterial surface antigen (D15) domain-containing protein n=1 Tax=Aphanomyces astaci TaxID=112090 RepID=A0A397BA64_APHAT|nr:hypothetical protein DYB25_002149 [Aphanomyces astaci]RHZ19615.1 hypothetical protein DYB31_009127 [Aphanomyces astaci]
MELSTPYCSPTLFDNELQELRAFGIFDSVDILLEKTADGTRNETDVVITVKESRMLSLYAGVESSGAEGTAVFAEVAGLWGDVQFVKGEAEVQHNIPIGPVAFHHPIFNIMLSSRVGAVHSYGADKLRPARISDRFFLGGPLSLRGFNHKGVGPRANPDDGGVKSGDALGGEVFYSVGASLGFPFPLPLLAVH